MIQELIAFIIIFAAVVIAFIHYYIKIRRIKQHKETCNTCSLGGCDGCAISKINKAKNDK